jgi:hypothetical protein
MSPPCARLQQHMNGSTRLTRHSSIHARNSSFINYEDSAHADGIGMCKAPLICPSVRLIHTHAIPSDVDSRPVPEQACVRLGSTRSCFPITNCKQVFAFALRYYAGFLFCFGNSLAVWHLYTTTHIGGIHQSDYQTPSLRSAS